MDYGSGNGEASAAALAIVLGIIAIEFAIIALVLVINYVLYGFALMLFFRKVGVNPRIAWVPYYRYWKWLEVGGQQGWWSLIALVPFGGGILTAVFLCIGMWHTGKGFGKDAGMLVLGIFLPFVWLFILGSKAEVYHPEWITAAGYPPPLAGYGSARGPYVPPTPPTAPPTQPAA
jgi:hypothetical protein